MQLGFKTKKKPKLSTLAHQVYVEANLTQAG